MAEKRPWWLLPPGRIHWAWWAAICALFLWIEYATGIYTQLPVGYVIPVSLAAWYSGRGPALVLAAVVFVAHLAFPVLSGTQAEELAVFVPLTTLRGGVIVVMALWFARLSEHERDLRQEVDTLKGLLRICSFCKSIKNESGEWEHLERFISRRSNTQFSHGMCPSCQATHYGNLGEPAG